MTTPLIIEQHPEGYEGYPFITLLQYRGNHYLTIVDNVSSSDIKAYVLDLCGPFDVNEEKVIVLANEWYTNFKDKHPISINFSRANMSTEMSKIYRSFNIEFVTRVIGPLPKYEMEKVVRIKKRKKKVIENIFK